MNEVFDVHVTKDRLSASLTVKDKYMDSEGITFQILNRLASDEENCVWFRLSSVAIHLR